MAELFTVIVFVIFIWLLYMAAFTYLLTYFILSYTVIYLLYTNYYTCYITILLTMHCGLELRPALCAV